MKCNQNGGVEGGSEGCVPGQCNEQPEWRAPGRSDKVEGIVDRDYYNHLGHSGMG